jgi:SAM-dependent methyltransferase
MAAARSLDYNPIASDYERRYTAGVWSGVAATLNEFVKEESIRRAVEVGCGTGHWLSMLRDGGVDALGLDLSFGMLQQARQRDEQLVVLNGRAHQLPLPDGIFDLVLCVNAFHHFDQPARVIVEARRLLRAGGVLAIIGLNPHARRDHWFIYDYFPGTLAADVQRYSSTGALVDWMIAAGFARTAWGTAERTHYAHVGRAILDDYFLKKHATSQLAQLSDEAYAIGLERITAAIANAELLGTTLEFPVDLGMELVLGWASG